MFRDEEDEEDFPSDGEDEFLLRACQDKGRSQDWDDAILVEASERAEMNFCFDKEMEEEEVDKMLLEACEGT